MHLNDSPQARTQRYTRLPSEHHSVCSHPTSLTMKYEPYSTTTTTNREQKTFSGTNFAQLYIEKGGGAVCDRSQDQDINFALNIAHQPDPDQPQPDYSDLDSKVRENYDTGERRHKFLMPTLGVLHPNAFSLVSKSTS